LSILQAAYEVNYKQRLVEDSQNFTCASDNNFLGSGAGDRRIPSSEGFVARASGTARDYGSKWRCVKVRALVQNSAAATFFLGALVASSPGF